MSSRPGRPPPSLPPRTPSTSPAMDEPPPYELVAHQQRALEKAAAALNPSQSASGLMRNDPRSTSQESLAPEHHDGRRKLLLIYVHGFMGNETSFRSFPAHVHNLLAILLSDSHVVHTKVYPRYRSKGNISIARNDFSKWLQPHEHRTTDVVLLGHSMGGLLSAEVALMPATRPTPGPLQHRIVGTINFDVPFLGMHPGVVKSGLASVFTSDGKDEPKDDEQSRHLAGNPQCSQNDPSGSAPSRTDTLWAKPDQNYNPAFQNDVVLPVRKGWRSAWHFVNKHSDDLIGSAKKLISSHVEFGGAMANYGELKNRYARIRALEEENGKVRESVVEGGLPPRVRFINYYTASTGRPKKASSPHRKTSQSPHRSRPSSQASNSRIPTAPETGDAHRQSASFDSTDVLNEVDTSPEQWENAMESLQIGDASEEWSKKSDASLPPKPPPLGDLSYIQDPKIQDMVRQDHEKAAEAYEKAVTEQRQRVEKERQQRREEPARSPPPPPPVKQKPESELTHSEREATRLEKERDRMETEARRMRGEKDPQSDNKASKPQAPTITAQHSTDSVPQLSSRRPSTTISTLASTSTHDTNMLSPQPSKDDTATKPKKDRMFCTLPPKDSNGERDPCWVRVFMQNVDEVGAHCGLFFVDERYERLVGDVSERIEGWIKEDLSARAGAASRVGKP
ncbi:hypothetical protein DOTSEDRAFT_68869 [Dothistroma septosporum NZE10]|uniref:AB hydrolase-1 domain-containing protein n=1 Tax=Dothistroma septosporum (strain NZE10 / CBS 128990) TaxID=675120 RepID=N1Q5B8_DOTSN|nr:hypothetical protein DOTSEDRAFT_68869 [Dothistroma septosporum NZE10]